MLQRKGNSNQTFYSVRMNWNQERVDFGLPCFWGYLSLEYLLDVEKPVTEKMLNLVMKDPRSSGRQAGSADNDGVGTLALLKDVHRHIINQAVRKPNAGCHKNHEQHLHSDLDEWCSDALKVLYVLAAIYHLYFFNYGLYHEDWGCQAAWLHLLRLRYRALIALHQQDHEDSGTMKAIKNELLLSRRDWERYCRDPDTRFMFSGSNPDDEKTAALRLGDVEQEMRGVLAPAGSITPYRLFTEDEGGRSAFARIVREWFLSERYDWRGALLLAVGSWKERGWSARIFALLLLSISTAPLVVLMQANSDGWMPILLAGLYGALLSGAIIGIVWRPFLDLALPRVWAASVVGYLALAISPETWKLIYGASVEIWKVYLIVGAVLLVSWFYLLWQIGRFLGRPSWLSRNRRFWIIVGRSSIILVLSFAIALLTGLVMMDFGIGYLGGSILKSSDDIGEITAATHAFRTPFFDLPISPAMDGVLGTIYIHALLIFAPFALLIGIIVQLFWQEKPVTESE